MLEAIRGRQSIRAFTNQPVSEKEIETLIDAARHAPSAGNIQPWEFVIVREPEIKRELVLAASNQASIEEAPVVIVVCADENRCAQRYGERGRSLYCLQDTAAAIQNIHLTVYALGLGTCWIGAFKEEETRETLNIPVGIRPVGIIPIGYAAESPQPPNRRATSKIVHYESF